MNVKLENGQPIVNSCKGRCMQPSSVEAKKGHAVLVDSLFQNFDVV